MNPLHQKYNPFAKYLNANFPEVISDHVIHSLK